MAHSFSPALHNAAAQATGWIMRMRLCPQAEIVLAKFNLNNQAAATFGDYMQPFAADLSQHHILDPRTGYSAPELASVTVTAPSVMLAVCERKRPFLMYVNE